MNMRTKSSVNVLKLTLMTNDISSINNKPKWFDYKCYKAKREFKTVRNIFSRQKSNKNRILFTRARTKYNKIRRNAKFKYKVNAGQRLGNMAKTQPRKLWKTLKKCYKKSNNKTNEVKLDDLYDHFNSL